MPRERILITVKTYPTLSRNTGKRSAPPGCAKMVRGSGFTRCRSGGSTKPNNIQGRAISGGRQSADVDPSVCLANLPVCATGTPVTIATRRLMRLLMP
jgi:hypothetical protein